MIATAGSLGGRTAPHRRALALLAVLLLAISAAGCLPQEEQSFLDRTNAARRSQGIRVLSEHGVLTQKAEAWAQHMAQTRTLAHSTLSAGRGALEVPRRERGRGPAGKGSMAPDPQQLPRVAGSSGQPAQPEVHAHGGGRGGERRRSRLGR